MHYFFNSLWLGALFSPPCWKCALKRNPFMSLLIVIPLFLVCGLFQSALILSVIWLVGMFLFIITPRNRFKLKENNKTLYFFCYDTYNKWKISVKEQNRGALLRVFVHEDGHMKKVGDPMLISGFDDSLLHLGFFLVKSPYAEWNLWGNGFDKHGNPFFLGRKMASYFFISTDKRTLAYLIHGKIVVFLPFDGVQKFNQVFFDSSIAVYKEIDNSQDCTTSADAAFAKNGCFILLEYKGSTQLYKVINEVNAPSAYHVCVPWFSLHYPKNGEQSIYTQHNELGYVKSRS